MVTRWPPPILAPMLAPMLEAMLAPGRARPRKRPIPAKAIRLDDVCAAEEATRGAEKKVFACASFLNRPAGISCRSERDPE